MPVVRVAFYEGRSVEKKRAIAEAITDALVCIGGSTRRRARHLREHREGKTG